MKFLVADAAGNILRQVQVPDLDAGRLQLREAGHVLWRLPDDAGLVHDGKLVVAGGVLALKPGVASAAGVGLAVAVPVEEPEPEPEPEA